MTNKPTHWMPLPDPPTQPKRPARMTQYATVPLEPLLTVGEAADILKVSGSAIYKLVNTGALNKISIGTSVRIHPADLAEYVSRVRGRHEVKRYPGRKKPGPRKPKGAVQA